jgi:hypothetical protein
MQSDATAVGNRWYINPSNGAKAPFLLWEPFHPITDDVAILRPIIFVLHQKAFDPLRVIAERDLVTHALPDNHMAGMGNEVGQLESGNVVALVPKLQMR